MATLEFIVPQIWDGKSASTFLRGAHNLSGTTIKYARRAESGLTMDGQHLRTVDPVRAGAVVRVKTDILQCHYVPSAAKVEQLYEDEDLLIFNKPAGMPCHPSKGHPYDTLANVFAALPSVQGVTFRAIGRLDKDTTGAVLCAKHAHAAYLLGNMQKVYKYYLALVPSKLPQPDGSVDAPIARESADSQRRCVREDGQRAVTHYRTLLAEDDVSLIALWLETGRTHQIRVHMAHIGCPLLGDVLYGGNCQEMQRHALHCRAMALLNPLTKTPVAVFAHMSDDMSALLASRFSKQQISVALAQSDAIYQEGYQL